VGIVAVINSFLMLATMFTVMGTQTSILRLIPEHLETQWMVIGVSVITAALFFFSAHLVADKVFSKPHLANYFALASVFIVFQAMMKLNTSAVRGLRMIKLFAVMQFLPQACNLTFLLAAGFLWPAKDVPVHAVLFGIAATGITGWFAMELAFKKRMQPGDNVCPLPARAILSISMPMLMSDTMVFVIGQTDVLMLGMFRTEAEVGYYAIAVKLATLTTFVLQAINSMAAPKFSELYHTGKMEELFYVAKKSTKLIFATTIPILFCLIVFGRPILDIVFGHDFIVAYPALLFLAAGQFINSISGSSGTFLNMIGKQKVFRNIMAIAAMLNIGLNLLLIPHFGIKGAALTSMISLCFWNISTLIYMKIKFGRTTGYFPGLYIVNHREV